MAEEGNLRDKISQEVNQGFTTITGTLASHTQEVLGDALGSLINDIKNMAGGALSFLKSGVMGIGSLFGFGKKQGKLQERTLDEQKEQTGLLQGILKYFRKEQKEEMRGFKPDEEGMFPLGMLGLIGAALGLMVGSVVAVIGGITKYFLIPFQVLGKAIKSIIPISKWFDSLIIKIVTLLNKTKIGTKFLNMFSKFFGWMGKAVGWIGKIFRMGGSLLSKIGMVGNFLAGFSRTFGFVLKGVPVIGWAITAIMGIIDFFKGFSSEQGSLIDKIKAGLIEAILGFLDPIIKLFGWIADKILGLFGIQVEGGSASKIFDFLEKYIPKFFDWITTIFGTIFDFLSWSITNFVKYGKKLGIFDAIASIIGTVFDVIVLPFKLIWDGLKLLWNLFTGDFSGAANNIKSIFDTIWSTMKSIFSGLFDWIMTFTPIGWAYKGLKKLWDFMTGGKGEKKDKKSIFDKIIDFIKDIPTKLLEFIKNILPSPSELIKGLKDKVIEKAKDVGGWLADFVGVGDDEKEDKAKEELDKAKNKPKTDVPSMSGLGAQTAADQANATDRNTQQQKKTQEAQEKQTKKQEQTTNNVMIPPNVGPQQQKQPASDEPPDQVEHYGLTFMNSSTLGPGV